MTRKPIGLTDDKGAGWSSPAPSGTAVVPSDTVNLPKLARLYVGVTGDVAVILANDTAAVTLTACQVGYHPLIVKRVMATNTTAADIVALYMD